MVPNIRVSVRNLIEFILRAGDLDNRRLSGATMDAMSAGSRIHRMIQRRMGDGYRSEVFLRCSTDAGAFSITVEGRADGVVTGEDAVARACGGAIRWAPAEASEDTACRAADGAVRWAPDEVSEKAVAGAADGAVRWDGGEGMPVAGGTGEETEYVTVAESGGDDARGVGIRSGMPDEIRPKAQVDETKPEALIDEIKGVYRPLDAIEAPVPMHLAQAKCYGHMLCVRDGLERVALQVTYCHLETEECKRFVTVAGAGELDEWFSWLVAQYVRWATFEREHRERRDATIGLMEFPFPYRQGQKKLAVDVYRTIDRGKRLFIQAPTGIGKTLSVIFPALKAMGLGKGEKLFYLTARTITRQAAQDALNILRGRGLHFSSVTVTAKEKLCVLGKPDCNPDACPRAKGHFDRVNDAVFACIGREIAITRETVLAVAEAFSVCPFELCLDLTNWVDGIICDYNYVFHPRVRLGRYFGDGVGGGYLFLVDEAHNLLGRVREMYSAQVVKEEILEFRRLFMNRSKKISGHLKKVNDLLLGYKRAHEGGGHQGTEGGGRQGADGGGHQGADGDGRLGADGGGRHGQDGESASDGLAWVNIAVDAEVRVDPGAPAGTKRHGGYSLPADISPLVMALINMTGELEEYLDEHHEFEGRDDALTFYFDMTNFIERYAQKDDGYRVYSYVREDGSFAVRVFCINPSNRIEECLEQSQGTVLFSATFLPMVYYRELLGKGRKDYAVYVDSPFPKGNRALFVARDVSSTYKRRGAESYRRVAAYITAMMRAKTGNYMVFFPSYQYMENVYGMMSDAADGADNKGGDEMEAAAAAAGGVRAGRAGRTGQELEIRTQGRRMDEGEREAFLAAFDEGRDHSFAAFCVTGGMFSEGIDLAGDRLIGVAVVGTGLPQVCVEQEVLKEYFAGQGSDGFAYAYQYPGMNKVLQAAGRVIRTAQDVGVILLLDDRFLRRDYQFLFPREWDRYRVVTCGDVGDALGEFWEEHGT
ncbi:MAG: ATP-dependent DNA helicase [Lachnospiraceae bacterium]|jgi:Rad3-related DNA helicase|nr:ATP-dependent DNA helicase [Lachnospiraceae bacterium]